MKKELFILAVGLILGISIITFINVTNPNKGDVPVPKPFIGDAQKVKLDTIAFNCNDATMIKFIYGVNLSNGTKRDTLQVIRDAKMSLKDFALSKNSEYFYKLETPDKRLRNVTIMDVIVEDKVAQRIKKRDSIKRERDSIKSLAVERIVLTIQDSKVMVEGKLKGEEKNELWLYFKNDWLEVESTYINTSIYIDGWVITNIKSGGYELGGLTHNQRKQIYDALYNKLKEKRVIETDNAIKNINKNFGN